MKKGKAAPATVTAMAEHIAGQAMKREKCWSCHGTDFWKSKHGPEVCRACHPPAPGAEKKS